MNLEIFLRRMLFGLITANFAVLVWSSFFPAPSSTQTEGIDEPSSKRTAPNNLISEYSQSAGSGKMFGSSESDMEEELLNIEPRGTDNYRFSHENCLIFDPFVSYEDAETIANRIRNQGGRVHIEEQVISREPDYLVYIEPASSREMAQRMLRELKGQSIDSYIIADGTLADGLSVGVFPKLALAQAKKRRVADLGYEVNLAPLGQPRTVYWVLYNEVLIEGPGPVDTKPCGAVAYVPSIL